MSNRPNYILELKDGRTIEFVPHGQCDHTWVGSGRQFHVSMLEAIGATPVPQEEPKVPYYCSIRPPSVKGDGIEEGWCFDLEFKSHEDAENYRLRCESIGPEWTDWEPVIGGTVWGITPDDTVYEHPWTTLYVPVLLAGGIHPTKERAQEWLAGFGKAWGLM